MAHIDQYLSLAVQGGASDIHFSTGEPVRMRVDGDLVPMGDTPLTSDQVQQIMFEICSPEEQSVVLEHKNLDKSYQVSGLSNFRLNIFMNRKGMAAVLRAIPSEIPTMAKLGLPEILKTLTSVGQGLVLVTGPTGSGKSTTLAAMVNHINETCPYHILTIEDPVEFVHQSKRSLINQREIGHSCPTFSDALKYALREDPDVILVGEMRDLETISLALTASETGHLVFGTLHTRGASASIDRVIDSFPPEQQAMIRSMMSESLVAVISQTLLKKIGGGRVAAYEIMVVTPAIANLIREGKTFQINSAIQTGKREGMVLMDTHIRHLLQKGVISKETAMGAVENQNSLNGVQGKSVPQTQAPRASVAGGGVPAPGAVAGGGVPVPGAVAGGGVPAPGAVAGGGVPAAGAAAPGGARPPSMPGMKTPTPNPMATPAPSPMVTPAGVPAPPDTSVPSPEAMGGEGPAPPKSFGAGADTSFSPQPLTLGDKTQAEFRIRPPHQARRKWTQRNVRCDGPTGARKEESGIASRVLHT